MAFRIAWFGVGALAFWVTGRPIAALVLAGVFAASVLMLGTLRRGLTVQYGGGSTLTEVPGFTEGRFDVGLPDSRVERDTDPLSVNAYPATGTIAHHRLPFRYGTVATTGHDCGFWRAPQLAERVPM